VEAPGDHQVENEPKLVLKSHRDPLAQASNCNDSAPV
jgi:hypothetical protein